MSKSKVKKLQNRVVELEDELDDIWDAIERVQGEHRFGSLPHPPPGTFRRDDTYNPFQNLQDWWRNPIISSMTEAVMTGGLSLFTQKDDISDEDEG